MSTLRASVCKKLGLSATASQTDVYRAALKKIGAFGYTDAQLWRMLDDARNQPSYGLRSAAYTRFHEFLIREKVPKNHPIWEKFSDVSDEFPG